MKLRYVALAIILVMLNICGCAHGKTNETSFHNEILGRYVAFDDTKYYIRGTILYKYSDNNETRIGEHIMSVQKNMSNVYCIQFSESDHVFEYVLCKVTDSGLETIVALGSGAYQQSLIHNNSLYIGINGEVYKYDLETLASMRLPIENEVASFAIAGKKLVYWNITYKDMTMDDFVASIADGKLLSIADGVLYSFDLETNESNEIYKCVSDGRKGYVSPVGEKIAFYDSDANAVCVYNGINVKLLINKKISSFVTDDEYIYYSAYDTNIYLYRLNVKTMKVDVLAENTLAVLGMDDKYIFNGMNCVAYESSK